MASMTTDEKMPAQPTHKSTSAVGGPFDLSNSVAYAQWRTSKLADYPTDAEQLIVKIGNPPQLSTVEYEALLRSCRKANMVIYAADTGGAGDKTTLRAIGHRFGLRRLDHNLYADDDSISLLQVVSDESRQGYIPYTNRPIAWHTDGYYNPPKRQIHSFVLHCVENADSGGANDLMDHEIVYLMLRDENPDYIRALSQPDAMTIPANIIDGKELRPAQTGPVFSISADGRLHMRFTARTRSIEWSPDPLIQDAVDFLMNLLREPSPYRFSVELMPGQGILCNNVLHTRSRFENGKRARLLYRARYYDRIAGT